jgi:serine/threonine-protein kinase
VLAGLGAVGEDPHPTQVVQPVREISLFDQDQPKGTATHTRPRPALVAREPKRTRSAAPFLLGAVVAIAVAAAAFVLARPTVGPSTAVPLLVGRTFGNAQEIALRSKLLIDSSYRNSDDPRDTIIAQDPPAGDFANQRTSVHVWLSRGPHKVQMPELVGMTQAQATEALQSSFAVKVATESSLKYPEGQVIRSEPNGTAPPDSEVTLYVSTGPPLLEVPNVAGRTYDAAAARLRSAKFAVARVDAFDGTVPPGQVVRTQPAAGSSARQGSTVSVVVSKGPDLVVVPNFVGKTLTLSTELAAQTGVQLAVQGVISPGHPVRAQAPPPGGQVPRGTVVTVFF